MRRMGIVLEFGEPFCRLGGSTVTVPGPKDATGMTVKEALAAVGISVNDLDGTLDPDLSAFVTVNGRPSFRMTASQSGFETEMWCRSS